CLRVGRPRGDLARVQARSRTVRAPRYLSRHLPTFEPRADNILLPCPDCRRARSDTLVLRHGRRRSLYLLIRIRSRFPRWHPPLGDEAARAAAPTNLLVPPVE